MTESCVLNDTAGFVMVLVKAHSVGAGCQEELRHPIYGLDDCRLLNVCITTESEIERRMPSKFHRHFAVDARRDQQRNERAAGAIIRAGIDGVAGAFHATTTGDI